MRPARSLCMSCEWIALNISERSKIVVCLNATTMFCRVGIDPTARWFQQPQSTPHVVDTQTTLQCTASIKPIRLSSFYSTTNLFFASFKRELVCLRTEAISVRSTQLFLLCCNTTAFYSNNRVKIKHIFAAKLPIIYRLSFARLAYRRNLTQHNATSTSRKSSSDVEARSSLVSTRIISQASTTCVCLAGLGDESKCVTRRTLAKTSATDVVRPHNCICRSYVTIKHSLL